MSHVLCVWLSRVRARYLLHEIQFLFAAFRFELFCFPAGPLLSIHSMGKGTVSGRSGRSGRSGTHKDYPRGDRSQEYRKRKEQLKLKKRPASAAVVKKRPAAAPPVEQSWADPLACKPIDILVVIVKLGQKMPALSCWTSRSGSS